MSSFREKLRRLSGRWTATLSPGQQEELVNDCLERSASSFVVQCSEDIVDRGFLFPSQIAELRDVQIRDARGAVQLFDFWDGQGQGSDPDEVDDYDIDSYGAEPPCY